MRLSLCLAALCALCLPATRLHADWPQWRGPGGAGVWPNPNAPEDFASRQPKALWRQAIGGGYSGLSTAAGRLYSLDRPKSEALERLQCRSALTGELLWQQQWPADYGSMEYANGPRSCPTIANGLVYVLGATGMASAFQADTGKLVWQVDCVATHQAKRPTWGFAASPVLHGSHLLLHVGAPQGSVLALDANTGSSQWKGGEDPAGYCTPQIIEHHQQRQLISWGPKHIESLVPESGKLNWRWAYPVTYGVSIAQPIHHDGLLLVSGYWHGTRTLQLGETPADPPRLAWENRERICGLMSTGLRRGEVVYLLDKSQGLQAIELRTGRILWSDDKQLESAAQNPQMSLVWLDEAKGLAAGLNSDGELLFIELKPEGRRELARHQLIGKTWAHPAFDGPMVFLRSDSTLAAWKLW